MLVLVAFALVIAATVLRVLGSLYDSTAFIYGSIGCAVLAAGCTAIAVHMSKRANQDG